MRSTRRPAALAVAVVVLIVGGMLAGGVAPALASLTTAASPTPAATPAPSGGASAAADKAKIPKESWAAVPVQPPNSIALRSSFFLEGQPGATIYDAVQISNFTGKRLPLTLYASDAGNIPKGGIYTAASSVTARP